MQVNRPLPKRGVEQTGVRTLRTPPPPSHQSENRYRLFEVKIHCPNLESNPYAPSNIGKSLHGQNVQLACVKWETQHRRVWLQ